MKILLTLSLLFYTVNGFSFFSIFSQNEEISSLAASCTGVADGTRLPDETNCQKFTLCDGGFGLSLSCRSSDPYFYRCNSTCVNDMSVCQIKDCPGATTTTGATTTSATTTSATTTATDTTASATTTSATTTVTATPTTTVTTTATTTTVGTTTKFNPPTVPVSLCNPACSTTFATDGAACACIERWVCKGTTCECDTTIRCPTDKATCIKPVDPDGGCGCEEACSCTGTGAEEKCNCKKDVICPFNKDDCVPNCDCPGQCDDTVCKPDTSTPPVYTCTGCNKAAQCSFPKADCASKCGCANNCDCVDDTACTCKAKCACIEPPVVCPFKPSECASRCGCDKRCETTCNGDFCVCDPAVACTRNLFFWDL